MANEVSGSGPGYIFTKIDAMEKDRKRIRELFPDIKQEEWDDYTN